jgi:hypothetical protein
MLSRRASCTNGGSYGSFMIKGARWFATRPPALEAAWSCANCGAGATTPFSLQEARLCGFDEPD